MGIRPVSITKEGGIAVHINRFFRDRNSLMRFGDVVRLKDMRLGKRRLPIKQQADELGVSRAVLYKWHRHIDVNKEKEHAKSN